MDTDDTIVALASAAGGSQCGVIRVSGPEALAAVKTIFEPAQGALPDDGPAVVIDGQLSLSQLGHVPARLYLWPTNRSYTRQISVEVHTIGSPPILDAIVKSLVDLPQLRPAQAGEFTLRAFLAGRLDLTQAEAVLGVIDARTDDDLQQSLQQLAGGLVHPLHAARQQLLDAVAHLEAGLDFVEDDIEFITADQLLQVIHSARESLSSIQHQLRQRHDASTERRIVFWGAPNVGKSSLINAVAESAVAIVSNTAGTTRDYLTRTARMGDYLCELVDTAGIESAEQNSLQELAQQVTSHQQNRADLRVLCIDLSRQPTDWESRQIETNGSADDCLIVGTKLDLSAGQHDHVAYQVSSVTSAGLDSLKAAFSKWFDAHDQMLSPLLETAARCHANLVAAQAALDRAGSVHQQGGGEELVAMELRIALEEIGQIVGVVYTDDILDRVFSRFCIGK